MASHTLFIGNIEHPHLDAHTQFHGHTPRQRGRAHVLLSTVSMRPNYLLLATYGRAALAGGLPEERHRIQHEWEILHKNRPRAEAVPSRPTRCFSGVCSLAASVREGGICERNLENSRMITRNSKVHEGQPSIDVDIECLVSSNNSLDQSLSASITNAQPQCAMIKAEVPTPS